MNRFPFRLPHSNPFYFLSAACMLGGCLAITNSFHWSNIPTPRDLKLLATLNVYEAALIALAWYLIRRRQLIHDGVMLLALEAFFLADITFLNAQVVTSNYGLVLAVVLFAAAVVKVACMVTLAGLSLRDGRLAAMTMQLAMLFAVPFVFRHFDNGDLPTRFFYSAWWTAGLLIPACLMLSHVRTQPLEQPWVNGIARLLCVVPWLSFVMHVGILHYVYRVDFYAAEVAPVLLGLACLAHHLKPSSVAGRRDLLAFQCLFPAAAIFVSLSNPSALCFAVGKQSRFSFTPTDLGVAGAYLAYVYCLAGPYAIQCLAAGATAAMAYFYGPTTQQVGDTMSRTWTWVSGTVWSLVPKTAVNLGITAISAAFAFLGLGAVVSLRRREPQAPSVAPNVPEP